MDGPTAREASFGEVHFGKACLGDLRRTRRLVKTANLIMSHPVGTLPQKLSHWSDLMGLYRLLAGKTVTHESVIASHCQRTLHLARERAGQGEVVLLLHDQTELDYTHIPALAEQLGQIGNGGGRGYVCHNTLAVTVEREVLGLMHQRLHRRRQVPKGETPIQKREHPGRESLLWPGAVQTTQGSGLSPGGRRGVWVDIADRGADTFEFLECLHEQRRQYVVRSAKDRCLAGQDHVACDRIHGRLQAYARDLPTLGEQMIAVPRQQKTKRHPARAARQARVRLAAGPVSLGAGHFVRGHAQAESLELWVVHVREIDPPGDAEPLEWVLLTNVASQTLEQACQRVEWYRCRWMIEEFHKGMKSGLGIESMQFEHADRLEPAIALVSVVAAALLLQLRQAAREPEADRTPATSLVPRLLVQVLSGWRYRKVRDDLSVHEFTMALARLGGHLNRKNDGPPGWLTLWRGWQDLQLMIRGAEAIRCV
jgi:hypothetical protein